MKQFLQRSLRNFHWRFCRRPLPDRLGVYFHTLETDERPAFAEAMQWIQARGYRFVGPGEFLTATGRVCYVSFDDNFQAWHAALPFFAELGVRATFFLNTCVLRGECTPETMREFCRTINYRREFTPLSRDEIRELHAAGHWIGAHTHSHVALSRVSRTEAMEDLGKNKSILESIAGSPVTDVAFPFGLPRFFSREAQEVCVALGFRTISWATPGMLFAQGDPLAIHRTQWDYALGADGNAKNLAVNGRLFVRLTGRSPVG
jgi:peptidoglycan/xylan/chitin deacetylase (PgdA/CDA1 family)